VGAHPLLSTLSRRVLNPIKLAYSPSPPDNGLGQYVRRKPNLDVAGKVAYHAVADLDI